MSGEAYCFECSLRFQQGVTLDNAINGIFPNLPIEWVHSETHRTVRTWPQ